MKDTYATDQNANVRNLVRKGKCHENSHGKRYRCHTCKKSPACQRIFQLRTARNHRRQRHSEERDWHKMQALLTTGYDVTIHRLTESDDNSNVWNHCRKHNPNSSSDRTTLLFRERTLLDNVVRNRSHNSQDYDYGNAEYSQMIFLRNPWCDQSQATS